MKHHALGFIISMRILNNFDHELGEILRETHLRWFGHMPHRKKFMHVDGPPRPRKRGRLERTWMGVVRIDSATYPMV